MAAACSAATALVVVIGVAMASHDPDVTDEEAKCQRGTSLAAGKLRSEKTRCITKCEQRARNGQNPATDCVPPYAAATLSCVESRERKAEALETSKCAKDCPECYTGGDCAADADARVEGLEYQLDAMLALVYCDDAGSPDGLTPAEAKCADTVARSLTDLAEKKLFCLSRCRKDEHKAKVPVGSCTPPPSDARAAGCAGRAFEKAALLIDGRCESEVNSSADKPECHGPLTSHAWAALMEALVDIDDAGLYCGSPSGAFLD